MVSATLHFAVSRAHEADARTILVAARRGDAAAQAALFDAHKHRVARQVLRMTGDASSVDDLVQEVFIAAFSSLGAFRGDAQIETWLYTITANKVRNWWDSRRRRELRERRGMSGGTAEVESPEQQLEAGEHLARFYVALGKLPDKYREAFSARAIENLNLHEASRVLGVPISTVSYRTRRAEQLLCEMLGLPVEVEG